MWSSGIYVGVFKPRCSAKRPRCGGNVLKVGGDSCAVSFSIERKVPAIWHDTLDFASVGTAVRAEQLLQVTIVRRLGLGTLSQA